ncbi:hypothetical protein N7540_007273 [Penicillium herquei]|nr:hypothetical protein N7540_007273 [Penicillium herquei]
MISATLILITAAATQFSITPASDVASDPTTSQPLSWQIQAWGVSHCSGVSTFSDSGVDADACADVSHIAITSWKAKLDQSLVLNLCHNDECNTTGPGGCTPILGNGQSTGCRLGTFSSFEIAVAPQHHITPLLTDQGHSGL